jgi:hypothetical protein
MKWMMTMLLFLGAVGCSAGITEEQVRQDFLRIIGAQHQYLAVQNSERVAFGDGWDDGVEVSVYFDAKCKLSTPSFRARDACRNGQMQMLLSYQRNTNGKWIVLSSEVVPSH